MKKALIAISIILIVGLTSAFVYADAVTPDRQQPEGVDIEDREAWLKENIEWKRARVEEAVEEGLMTEEEADVWSEHFTEMEEFHRDNGFMPGCPGHRRGYGSGRRMMRGNRWGR